MENNTESNTENNQITTVSFNQENNYLVFGTKKGFAVCSLEPFHKGFERGKYLFLI